MNETPSPSIVPTHCEAILPPEALVALHRARSLLLQVLTALGFPVALLLPSATHLSPRVSAGRPRASRCPSRIRHILRPTCWHLLLSLGKMLAWFPGQLNYVAPVICRNSRPGVLGEYLWGCWCSSPLGPLDEEAGGRGRQGGNHRGSGRLHLPMRGAHCWRLTRACRPPYGNHVPNPL